jgi:periplasmic divalent cation tolerance protein
MDLRLVFVTASSLDEARRLAKAAVEARFAACANIIPGVESHYWWQGKLETGAECLVIFKTCQTLLGELEATIRQHHSYRCPEFVALAPEAVAADYRAWWESEVRR